MYALLLLLSLWNKVKYKMVDLQFDWVNCVQMKGLCVFVGLLHN